MEREFYIGLWMWADDAGWFRIRVDELGAALYSYQEVNAREEFVRACLDRLNELARVELWSCGHGLISNLVRYQRLAGESKRVYTFRDEHASCDRTMASTPSPAGPRGSPPGTGTGQEQEREPERGLAEYPSLKRLGDHQMVVSLTQRRWGWVPTEAQQSLISEVASRHGPGSIGFSRIVDLLSETDARNPIRVLVDADRDLKRFRRQRADAQEAESRRNRMEAAAWRLQFPDDDRGPTAIADLLKQVAIAELLRGPGQRS